MVELNVTEFGTIKIEYADRFEFDRLLRDWQREHSPPGLNVHHQVQRQEVPGSKLVIFPIPLDFAEHVKAAGIWIEVVPKL